MGHFVVFSNTVPCKEETNMAVASMMTCKIDLKLASHENPLLYENTMRSQCEK